MPESRDLKSEKKKRKKKEVTLGWVFMILVPGGTLELCPGQFPGRLFVVFENTG